MFHFPALPPPALCVQAGVMGNYAQSGFPIRKSPDQCLVADFRDVTGGVYKARERIHRDVADSRLLATPTSWGRVADPNPN